MDCFRIHQSICGVYNSVIMRTTSTFECLLTSANARDVYVSHLNVYHCIATSLHYRFPNNNLFNDSPKGCDSEWYITSVADGFTIQRNYVTSL